MTFGTNVAAVTAALGARADTVKVIHQRPALIQELTWRPQYALSLPIGRIEAAQDITFRFHNDQLFRITVRYAQARQMTRHVRDMIFSTRT